jgi:hypothetical protein
MGVARQELNLAPKVSLSPLFALMSRFPSVDQQWTPAHLSKTVKVQTRVDELSRKAAVKAGVTFERIVAPLVQDRLQRARPANPCGHDDS